MLKKILINSQFPSCTIFWPISHKTQQTLVTDYVIVGFCALWTKIWHNLKIVINQHLLKPLSFLILFLLSVGVEASESCRRIEAHLLVQDAKSAAQEAERALAEDSLSCQLLEKSLAAFAAAGDEEAMMRVWERIAESFPDKRHDQEILETMCWGILRKGRERAVGASPQLISVIGAALTRDMYALPFLISGLRHSNAQIRALSVELVAHFGDLPLQREIERLFHEEEVQAVRLVVIRCIGKLRIEALYDPLVRLVSHPRCGAAEQLAAIEALVHWRESVPHEELKKLARSKRAGLRQLACEVIAHLELVEEKPLLRELIADPRPDVQAASLRAWGLLALHPNREIYHAAQAGGRHPKVGVTAAWVCLLAGDEGVMRPWLTHSNQEARTLAAAAVAASGSRGVSLAFELLERSEDLYVQTNLAVGLIGQRKHCEAACRVLHRALNSEEERWMVTKEGSFQVLQRSQERHNPLIPNYPELVDQTIRLEMVNLLAIMKHPGVMEALKSFLEKRQWGVTGLAAETLLGEGDDAALALIRQLLDDPDHHIRLEAALVLATWGRDPSALNTLITVYSDADKSLRIKILEAISRLGDRRSVPFLIERLRDPSQTMRMIAASVLIQTLNR